MTRYELLENSYDIIKEKYSNFFNNEKTLESRKQNIYRTFVNWFERYMNGYVFINRYQTDPEQMKINAIEALIIALRYECDFYLVKSTADKIINYINENTEEVYGY